MLKISLKFLAILFMLIAEQITLIAQPIGTQIKTDTSGHISYWNGIDTWIAIAPGLPGQSLQFTAGVPSWVNNLNGIQTSSVVNIKATTAVSGGNILSDGGAKIIAKGVCWSTSPNPTIADNKTINGSGIGIFSTNITGLTPFTTYYIRAYATSSFGTAYGNEYSFSSTSILPILTTNSINLITAYTAISGGNISSDGGEIVTTRGVCWSTNHNPTIADKHTVDSSGIGTFTSNIIGLSAGTLYYLRAYLTNNAGTTYGNENSFTTVYPVYDYNGNAYDTVRIGTQYWLKQNLNVQNYNNGTAIPNETVNSVWTTLTSGAYCDYDNNPVNSATYGKLYNWYAVNTGNLCPTGWHIPSNNEFNDLLNYLEILSGGKLKETGTTHWTSTNSDVTNESRFSALPGGQRTNGFSNIGSNGYWWTATESSISNATMKLLSITNFLNTIGISKYYGLSVRCIKDLPNQINLPIINTTLEIIDSSNRIAGGIITSDGGNIIIERGVCWSTIPNPTIADNKTFIGNGMGSFTTSNIYSLNPGTTYYFRAFATNSLGTAYGNNLSFTTLASTEVVTDIDGNVYNVITIGAQKWLKQNLKTTHYNNGVDIPNVTNTAWTVLTTGARTYYNNDSINNNAIYGALYNWHTVNTGNLCPIGWHVPTDAEWTTLTNYLGGEPWAGRKLKATSLWNSPNTGATNSSSFTSLPGGYCNRLSGSFYNLGVNSYYWSSTELDSTKARFRRMSYNTIGVMNEFDDKKIGYSVRCIKD